MTPPLILASASPTRHALLAAAGLTFTVQTGRFDEEQAKRAARAAGTTPESLALALAHGKAAAVSALRPEAIVIGADQILLCAGHMFDKPADLAAARTHLLALRARTHHLVTAVTALRAGQPLWHHLASPSLTMRAFSDAALEQYLAAEADSVTTTVGGYRLEGRGIQLFEAIEGDHFSILGLPLLPLLAFLRSEGVIVE